MIDRSMLGANPPEHTRLRRLAAPGFGPKLMRGYEEMIEKRVATLLDAAATRDSFDLVHDVAAPLPIAVITDLLGLPDADTAAFERYGETMASALDGIDSLGHARRLMIAGLRAGTDLRPALRAARPRAPRRPGERPGRRPRRGPAHVQGARLDVPGAARRRLRDHRQPDLERRAVAAPHTRRLGPPGGRPGAGRARRRGDAALRPAGPADDPRGARRTPSWAASRSPRAPGWSP